MSRNAAQKARHTKACTGKIRHADRAAANAALTSLFNSGAARRGMGVYHCKACTMWHVGHIPGVRRLRRI